MWSKGNDITVSGDAKLKVRGGVEDDIDGAGAGIGDGGSSDEREAGYPAQRSSRIFAR